MLMVSLAGTFFGYLIFSAGIIFNSIPLLFIGRLIDGFTGGNISIAISAVADVSDPKSKAKNFGMVGMFFGLGFILGPFIGGKLAGLPPAGLATPFLFTAILSLLNILSMRALFRETLKVPIKSPVNIESGIKNLQRAFRNPNLRILFSVVFLHGLGSTFFFLFFSVLLLQKFNFTSSNIGDLTAWFGLCMAITQGLIVRKVSEFAGPAGILRITPLFLAISVLLFIPIPENTHIYVWIIFAVIALFQGLTMPNLTAIVSNSAKDNPHGEIPQGEIIGINQSLQSFSQLIPALAGGIIAAGDFNRPIILSSFFFLSGWAVFVFVFSKIQKPHSS